MDHVQGKWIFYGLLPKRLDLESEISELRFALADGNQILGFGFSHI